MKGRGGGKRNGRKRTPVEPDDRPRGYEAQRMRRLWRDIDDAKDKAGIGRAAAESEAPGWGLGAMLEHATALATDAAAWVAATAPGACDLVTSGMELLRAVPLVGRLVELVPVSSRASSGRPHADRARPGNGAGPPTPPVTPDELNGHWLH
jgi:hypothetical protein